MQLINLVWDTSNLPSSRTLFSRINAFTTSEYDFRPPSNLESIDELWIEMDYGIRSGVYLFHPVKANGCLFIYHASHLGAPASEDSRFNGEGGWGLVIPTLIRCGFTVLALSMPVYGAYSNPLVYIDGVTIRLTTHDKMFEVLDRPMRFFIEPVHTFLNIVGQGFKRICMMGLSGGGWTTTVCAALDPRIHRSYPVAGTVPLWLRVEVEGLGDAEQVWEPFYSIANYSELYVMGSVGEARKQIQFLNLHDPDVFAGTRHTQWVPKVQAAVSALGAGEYDFYLDETHTRHSISKEVLANILADNADVIDTELLVKGVEDIGSYGDDYARDIAKKALATYRREHGTEGE